MIQCTKISEMIYVAEPVKQQNNANFKCCAKLFLSEDTSIIAIFLFYGILEGSGAAMGARNFFSIKICVCHHYVLANRPDNDSLLAFDRIIRFSKYHVLGFEVKL